MRLNAIDDQLRRRVFWTCYICDRHSSSMLGRPLAIEEDEIDVEVSLFQTHNEFPFHTDFEYGCPLTPMMI